MPFPDNCFLISPFSNNTHKGKVRKCTSIAYSYHRIQGRREGSFQGFQETTLIVGHTIKARNLIGHIDV